MDTINESQFKVKTEIFEGPLDLLLSLIEKRKLFINDISLSKVTDDYIEYVKNLPQFSIPDSATFILIASTLLLIKSKSLLPVLNLTLEEEESIEDLERRLKEYQRIKDLSLHVKELFGKNVIYPKSQTRQIDPVFSPEDGMTVQSLFASIKEVIKSIPKVEKLPQAVIKKVISLEEMIGNLTQRIQSSIRISFKEFSSTHKAEKVNVIVSFLAMLELVKQGIIDVTQHERFADIHMETQQVGVPRYNN
jgi:segregation and condensation protein A